MNQPYYLFFYSTNSAFGHSLSPDMAVCGAKSDIQNPENSQNYNRYAYCFNNPMKYTDPSGYIRVIIDGLDVSWGNNNWRRWLSLEIQSLEMDGYLWYDANRDGRLYFNNRKNQIGFYKDMVVSTPVEIVSPVVDAERSFGSLTETRYGWNTSICSTWFGFGAYDTWRWTDYERRGGGRDFWKKVRDADFGHDVGDDDQIDRKDMVKAVAVVGTIASAGVIGECAITGATAWEWGIASTSFINNLDGVFINDNGESGIQQMVDDKYKMNVGVVKNTLSLLSLGTSLSGPNLYQTTQSGFKFAGAATDYYSIMQPNKSFIKKR